MSDYETNKNWSDNFIPEIIAILQGCFWPYTFVIGTPEEDQDECCDFKGTYKDKKDIIISSRVRGQDFWIKYPNDITLNENISTTTGKNEIFKIIVDRYADYYFIGFAHGIEFKLIDWKIYLLDPFRNWALYRAWILGKIPGIYHEHHITKHPFRSYDMSQIPNVKRFEKITIK